MRKTPLIIPLVGEPKISGSVDEDVRVENVNRLSAIVAGGSRPVKKGVWYYEARCIDKLPLLGWAVADYKKNVGSGYSNEVFYADFNKQQLFGGHGRVRTERFRFSSGDLIGCLIDLDRNCIRFSYNGSFLDSSLEGLDLSNPAGYIPIFEIKARSSVIVALTATSFCARVTDSTLAYSATDESESEDTGGSYGDELSKIFDQFVSSPGGDKCEGDELQKMFSAIGSTGDLDPIVFVFMWFVNVNLYVWEIHRENFVRAFAGVRCKNFNDIRRVLKNQQKVIQDWHTDEWSKYYLFVFYLLRSPHNKLNGDTAVVVWEMHGFNKWKFFDRWAAFVKEKQAARSARIPEEKRAKNNEPELIGKDVWESLPTIIESFKDSFEGYDADSLNFNSMFDDFIESLEDETMK